MATLTVDLIETGLSHDAAAVGACPATPFTEGLEGLRYNRESGRSAKLRASDLLATLSPEFADLAV